MRDALVDEMRDFADRIQKSYCDRIEDPVAAARHFVNIARAASDLASMLFVVNEMQKQQDEIDELRQKRAATSG